MIRYCTYCGELMETVDKYVYSYEPNTGEPNVYVTLRCPFWTPWWRHIFKINFHDRIILTER